MIYPKLKAKLDTRGMSREERNQLLAYDMIMRCRETMVMMMVSVDPSMVNARIKELDDDIDANLSNLGSYIEEVICKGNLSLHFESFDVKETEPIGLDILS